jgi:D-amino peptidase
MIGQHAMAGVQTGNLNHTQASRSIDYYKLNGKFIGEIAQFALNCGGLGIPMIFLSGDQAACDEAEELLPGVVTAAVKQGIGRNSAISLSAQASAQKIRENAATALKKHLENPFKPLVWEGPFVLEKRFFHTDTVDMVIGDPRYERVDSQTVRIRSESILDIIYA